MFFSRGRLTLRLLTQLNTAVDDTDKNPLVSKAFF